MKTFAALVFLVVLAVLGLAVATPITSEVREAVSIKASPWRVYAVVNDLRRFPKWSPWEHDRDAVKSSFVAAGGGKPANYEWSGGSEVTHGRVSISSATGTKSTVMTFDFARPFAPLGVPIEFVPPFMLHATGELEIVSRGGSTLVIWAMRSKYSPADHLKRVVARLDDAIAEEMAFGLIKLKELVEG